MPKVKCNFFEIAQAAGVSKEACKLHLEQQIKKFSDSARKNVPTEIDLPGVGHLSIKNNIAGVLFKP